MKKLLIVLLLCWGSLSLSAQSASVDTGSESKAEKEPRFSLLINPLIIIPNIISVYTDGFFDLSFFGIGFEFQCAINKYFCLSIEPRFATGSYTPLHIMCYGMYGYGIDGLYLDDYTGGKHTLVTITTGFLFKPFGTMLEGFYAGLYPMAGYKNLSRKDEQYRGADYYPQVNDDFFVLGFTVGAGYQWIFNNGFTITTGAALGKTWEIGSNNNKGNYQALVFPYNFIINLKIGSSF